MLFEFPAWGKYFNAGSLRNAGTWIFRMIMMKNP